MCSREKILFLSRVLAFVGMVLPGTITIKRKTIRQAGRYSQGDIDRAVETASKNSCVDIVANATNLYIKLDAGSAKAMEKFDDLQVFPYWVDEIGNMYYSRMKKQLPKEERIVLVQQSKPNGPYTPEQIKILVKHIVSTSAVPMFPTRFFDEAHDKVLVMKLKHTGLFG